MRLNLVAIAITSAVVLAACNRDNDQPPPVPAAATSSPAADAVAAPAAQNEAGNDRTSWSEDALRIAEGLSKKLEAADIACREYGPVNIRMYDEKYRRRLPVMPAAVAACDSHGGEELLFEVFENAERAQKFMADKMAVLCKNAKEMQLTDFPGLAYVDGGTWIVEPDEKETADRIAPALGGESKLATCP